MTVHENEQNELNYRTLYGALILQEILSVSRKAGFQIPDGDEASWMAVTRN